MSSTRTGRGQGSAFALAFPIILALFGILYPFNAVVGEANNCDWEANVIGTIDNLVFDQMSYCSFDSELCQHGRMLGKIFVSRVAEPECDIGCAVWAIPWAAIPLRLQDDPPIFRRSRFGLEVEHHHLGYVLFYGRKNYFQSNLSREFLLVPQRVILLNLGEQLYDLRGDLSLDSVDASRKVTAPLEIAAHDIRDGEVNLGHGKNTAITVGDIVGDVSFTGEPRMGSIHFAISAKDNSLRSGSDGNDRRGAQRGSETKEYAEHELARYMRFTSMGIEMAWSDDNSVVFDMRNRDVDISDAR